MAQFIFFSNSLTLFLANITHCNKTLSIFLQNENEGLYKCAILMISKEDMGYYVWYM